MDAKLFSCWCSIHGPRVPPKKTTTFNSTVQAKRPLRGSHCVDVISHLPHKLRDIILIYTTLGSVPSSAHATSSQLSSEITTPLRGHARFQGVRNQGVYPRHLNWHFCIPFDHAKTARGLHGCGLWGLAHHRGHHFLPMGLKGLKWSESSSRHRDVYVCLMFTQR